MARGGASRAGPAGTRTSRTRPGRPGGARTRRRDPPDSPERSPAPACIDGRLHLQLHGSSTISLDSALGRCRGPRGCWRMFASTIPPTALLASSPSSAGATPRPLGGGSVSTRPHGAWSSRRARATPTPPQRASSRVRAVGWGSGSAPSERAITLIPALVDGLEWGDAMSALASLDIRPDEVAAVAQTGAVAA